MPATKATMPTPFHSRHHPEADSGSGSIARKNIAQPIKSAPQASICAIDGSTGETIQIATANDCGG